MITFEKGSKLESISGVRDLGAFDGAINLTTVDMSECTQVKRIDEYTFLWQFQPSIIQNRYRNTADM